MDDMDARLQAPRSAQEKEALLKKRINAVNSARTKHQQQMIESVEVKLDKEHQAELEADRQARAVSETKMKTEIVDADDQLKDMKVTVDTNAMSIEQHQTYIDNLEEAYRQQREKIATNVANTSDEIVLGVSAKMEQLKYQAATKRAAHQKQLKDMVQQNDWPKHSLDDLARVNTHSRKKFVGLQRDVMQGELEEKHDGTRQLKSMAADARLNDNKRLLELQDVFQELASTKERSQNLREQLSEAELWVQKISIRLASNERKEEDLEYRKQLLDENIWQKRTILDFEQGRAGLPGDIIEISDDDEDFTQQHNIDVESIERKSAKPNEPAKKKRKIRTNLQKRGEFQMTLDNVEVVEGKRSRIQTKR